MPTRAGWDEHCAPASAPGLDGVQPSAYQGNAAGRPYDPIPVETPSPYPTAGLPPEFAAVMAAAAAQQRVIKRSVGRSLFAVLLPLRATECGLR